jgi:hypothetical protein
MVKQHINNTEDVPESPEDALMHIARNTAKTLCQVEMLVEQNKKMITSLNSISRSAVVVAVISVSVVIFALYTWQRLESLAETARVMEMLRAQ